MTKKHFISLANAISSTEALWSPEHLEVLAEWCKSENSNFNKERWISYIKGECGPSGGKVKS